jgi:hypothetical protein
MSIEFCDTIHSHNVRVCSNFDERSFILMKREHVAIILSLPTHMLGQRTLLLHFSSIVFFHIIYY